jgi:hypothetical protein
MLKCVISCSSQAVLVIFLSSMLFLFFFFLLGNYTHYLTFKALIMVTKDYCLLGCDVEQFGR